jgi:copper transport protein
MSAVRRAVMCLLVALSVLGSTTSAAWAHASLVGSTPPARAHVEESPSAVVLRFSEPVQVVNRSDVTVVNHNGARVDAGTPRTASGDPRRVIVPLHRPLTPDSYTVRFRVLSADSHSAVQALAYATGGAALRPPVLAGAGGLSDSSPAAVGARVFEFAALGLLVGLLGFRALVFGPALARASARGLDDAGRETALRRGQQWFWRAFWMLAVLAGAAEAFVLAAKSGVVFHTGLAGAVLHPDDALRLVSSSRFGDLLGLRYGALLILVAVAFATWSAETSGGPSAGRRGPLAVMGALGVAALTLLAGQGHASQAPLAPLSIAVDATHLAAVAIWVGGLPCLAVVLRRAPGTLASATLRRFSRIALLSVAVIALTGLARLAGELSSPAQLLTTGYGRDVMLKASLLAPILVLAQRSRRLIAARPDGLTLSAATLRSVARSVQTELVIAMGIITVAAILVVQIPGRS